MSHVPQKRGNAERLLAKALWHDGYRYYLNYRLLPGSPDIAIPKYRIAIFVDGAFWHGYHWSEQKLHIKANREYWINDLVKSIQQSYSFIIQRGFEIIINEQPVSQLPISLLVGKDKDNAIQPFLYKQTFVYSNSYRLEPTLPDFGLSLCWIRIIFVRRFQSSP